MPTISIGTLRYDIISDTTRFVKGIKATARQKKEADRIFREGLSPMQKHNLALVRMYDLYKKGMITKEQVLHQQKKIKAELHKEQAALRMSGVDLKNYSSQWNVIPTKIEATSRALDRNTRAKLRNRAVGSSNLAANFGGSMGSAMGLGGPGAGMGRMMGYGMLGGVGAALLTMKKVLDETRELETALVDMQVIMGDDAAGTALVNNLREIARETPLTSKALIKGAQTLLGYGLSAEGLEDTMYRIGEIAGGDTARMDSLTRAFAQVQSAGKLMGQEMLQLVNAGFPVAEIAKAAGVSMEDFRKEMEEGNIKASHLTEAMVNLTSAGGMMEGRLARQADTINGKWITAMGGIDQQFAESGEKFKGFFKDGAQFIGEFVITSTKSLDGLFTYISDGLGSMGSEMSSWPKSLYDSTGITIPGTDPRGLKGPSDDLDENGKSLSGYKQVIRSYSDFLLVMAGYTEEEIEQDRKKARGMKVLSNARTAEAEERKKFAEGQKKIKESVDKEVADFKAAQKEKADAIYESMKPEEDLAAMRERHLKERWAARSEGTRLRANSGNQAANDYLAGVTSLQKAELAQYKQKVAKEKAEADAKARFDADKANEQRRFNLEKEHIKRVADAKKKQIQEEEEQEKRVANAWGKDRGKYTAMDSYSASAALEAEYEQNSIVNAANSRREEQLEDLKRLEKQAQKKADDRHKQNMKNIESNNTGKP